MKKIIFLVFNFYLFSTCILFSQLPFTLDSLKRVIDKMPADTAKANKLISFAGKTCAIDTSVAGKAARQAFQIASIKNDKQLIGNCYNFFGRLSFQTQKFEQAKANFRRAIYFFNEVNYEKGIASALNNLGVISNEQSNYDSAVFFFDRSLAIQNKLKNQQGVANCYTNIGNSLNLKGDYPGSIKKLLAAKTIYEKLNFWEGLSRVYYNLAYVHYNLKQLKQAEENIFKAMEIYETKTYNKSGLSYSYLFLAKLFSEEVATKNNDKAKNYYQKVITLSSEIGDQLGVISSLQGIGKIYFEEGKTDSLLSTASRALDLSKKIDHKFFMASSLSQLAEAYFLLKNYPLSIEYYKEAIQLSYAISDKTDGLRSITGLSNALYASGNYKEAFTYLNKALQLKDSIFDEANLRTASELEVKYENQKKMLEIENLNKDKKIKQHELLAKERDLSQKNIFLWWMLFFFLVVALFASYTYRNFKLMKKANLIINSQKEEVEMQKDLIANQKRMVEDKQKEIIDSINYAKRIQHAVLTGEEVWNRVSKEHFIFFQPKDIVSGDFYWSYNTPNNRSIWLVADCTGHGVPGAFMSMLGNSFLNEIVVEKRIYQPDEILNRLRDKVIAALEQKGVTGQQDGMDISVVVWNKLDKTIEFAGANNDGILIRNTEIIELKSSKMPIGQYAGDKEKFALTKLNVLVGDTIYLFSDGFQDQFGGDKGKKLKYKNFIGILQEIAGESAIDQNLILRQKFSDWKGAHEQLDDVCVIGVKLI